MWEGFATEPRIDIRKEKTKTVGASLSKKERYYFIINDLRFDG